MNFRQIVQDYFTFSRNERKGIIILLVIFFLLVIANKVIFYFETPAKIDADLLNAELNLVLPTSLKMEKKSGSLFVFNPNTITRSALDSLALPENIKQNLVKYREKGGKYYSGKDFKKIYGVNDSLYHQIEPFLVFESPLSRPSEITSTMELFAFDPNTASDSVLVRLGITNTQDQTIRNYQKKGGVFKKKEDFLKIYGIPESRKMALAEYVIIRETPVQRENINKEKFIRIEINGSDSIQLKLLPGIGNKLSKRIVKYRDMLGGYYTISQLKEVYGLREETFHQIETMVEIDSTKIQKININFANRNELSVHPYIRDNLARQIIKFRTRYGSISNPSVLRDSLILSQEEYERLKPYL